MSVAASSARILVVEDEPSIAEMIGLHLRHAGFQVLLALNAQEAHRAMQSGQPDLVLLDWMLPGQSGESVLRQWRSAPETQNVPVIMLTAKSSEEDKVAGLEAGADDYVTKPFSNKELLARVKALLRRHRPSEGKDVWAAGELRVDLSSHEVSVAGRPLKMGPAEFKLVAYFVQHPERVHSRVQLLTSVWGDEGQFDERTVDVHIKRLRDALSTSAGMIQTVRGAGYKLSVNPRP